MKPFPVHIDPGHGAQDSGITANGLIERKVVRDQASFLRQLLEARGYDVTVGPQIGADGKKFPNAKRVPLANKANAVLVCLHMNGGGGRYGLVEYHETNPQSRRLAGFLAQRYEACFGDLVTDVRVKQIGTGDRGSILLKGAKRSAVLSEPLFLDNPEHAEWLREHDNRMALCTAIADAIDDLVASL